jgi:plasmid stability protein
MRLGAKEKGKTFTIRNVPLLLHRQWKIKAANHGVTMEEFAMGAIAKAIEVLEQREKSRREQGEKGEGEKEDGQSL